MINYESRTRSMLWDYLNLGQTYQEIGNYFGLSRERVRQILNKEYQILVQSEIQRRKNAKSKIIICSVCGKETKTLLSQPRAYKQTTCSLICYKTSKRKIYICKRCGKIFVDYIIRNRQYCTGCKYK